MANFVSNGNMTTIMTGIGSKFQAHSDMVADEFSDSEDYAVDDVVIYNDVIYVCTEEHTAGAWDASHFTATTVEDLIAGAEPDPLTEQQITDLLALIGVDNT